MVLASLKYLNTYIYLTIDIGVLTGELVIPFGSELLESMGDDRK
jgi:hypothetical protein